MHGRKFKKRLFYLIVEDRIVGSEVAELKKLFSESETSY